MASGQVPEVLTPGVQEHEFKHVLTMPKVLHKMGAGEKAHEAMANWVVGV